MTLADQKAAVAEASESFIDNELGVTATEAAQAVLEDSTERGGGIRMQHVDKIYPGAASKALDDFNLDIKPGEMVVLLGGSGCGKSTALRALAGLEDIQAGRILVGGQDVTATPVNKRNMAMVFQADPLFPHMTALQNVEFGLEVRGMKKAERRRIAMEKLELVGLTDQAGKIRSRCPAVSSSAWRWPVLWPSCCACCCSMSRCPRWTPRCVCSCATRSRRIQLETGTTTVFVTHDQEEALAVADRIGVMNHGRIEQIAAPQDLYQRPATEYVATFIGLTNRLPGGSNGSEAVVFGQRVPLLEGSKQGPLVAVLVRPEALTLTPAEHEHLQCGRARARGDHPLPGRVGPCGHGDQKLPGNGNGGTAEEQLRVTVQLPASELPAGLSIGSDVVVAPRAVPALAV